MNDNERWLSDGNCMLCRREKYCQKPCKAQKERKAAILQAMCARAMLKAATKRNREDAE